MTLAAHLEQLLLQATHSKKVTNIQLIQGVWGGYGQLLRVQLSGGNCQSVVIKCVNTPQPSSHPKGWNSELSHQRKLTSYEVESYWYNHYAHAHQTKDCYVPQLLCQYQGTTTQYLVLEDLQTTGFPVVKESCSLADAKVCVEWLARFHAKHLQPTIQGLWSVGSYWHLATRPDEYEKLQDSALKKAAHDIDKILSDCPYQTLIHGDAKLANFCFSASGDNVAAVDFQYVGKGCGMKDLILFISSAISPAQCQQAAPILVDHYFTAFSKATNNTPFDAQQIEATWRPLYALAWADFQRFVKGWSPTHWKINTYTESLTQQALEQLDDFIK